MRGTPVGEQREWITCADLVELVTEYFEGALPTPDRRRFERHLVACPPCRAYLSQLRDMITAVGSLREDDVPVAAKEELLAEFRDWKREPD
jgi:anti-sigma factor RsiW